MMMLSLSLKVVLKTRKDIELLEKHHVNAVLIGEAMMKSHDKKTYIRSFKRY